jgi:hypothetical protein
MLLLGFHYSSFLRIDIAIAIAIDIILTLIIQNQSPLPVGVWVRPASSGGSNREEKGVEGGFDTKESKEIPESVQRAPCTRKTGPHFQWASGHRMPASITSSAF